MTAAPLWYEIASKISPISTGCPTVTWKKNTSVCDTVRQSKFPVLKDVMFDLLHTAPLSNFMSLVQNYVSRNDDKHQRKLGYVPCASLAPLGDGRLKTRADS